DNKNFVESRPIKGTRSRDKDLNQDALNAIDLITNEKDRAENIMIVDLIRNDLSKVCETGSIIVPEILKLESFLKVHHLTSVIRGKLKKGKNWIDLLKACWPGGSITGAPKLRSCQRLFELEEYERGPYCGSFLKLDWNGEFDSNILIRSFLIKDKKINIYAGCGIVI
ncbi:aminodeoxychorismate synthase component I, partial [Prochlorococcus sp. HOT_208_60]